MAATVELFFDSNADSVSNSFSKMGGKLGGLVSLATKAAAAFVAVNGVIAAGVAVTAKAAAEYESLTVSFETFLGSADEAAKLLQELEQFSLKTPLTPEQVNKSAETLLQFGFAGDEVVDTLKILGDTAKGNGPKLQSMAVIFGQIRGAGKLMGQDLLQLINAGFNPLQEMARTTGKEMSQLKAEMSKGAISFEQVQEAFVTATSAGGRFNNLMAKQAQTAEGLFSTLVGNFQIISREIGQNFLEAIKSALPLAINVMGRFREAISGSGGEISSVFREWAKLMLFFGQVAITVFKFGIIPLLAVVATNFNAVLTGFELLAAGLSKLLSFVTTGPLSEAFAEQAAELATNGVGRQEAIVTTATASFQGASEAEKVISGLQGVLKETKNISTENKQTATINANTTNTGRPS